MDVRSVADLQIKAMENPNAVNKRYLATAGYLKFTEIAAILKEEYPSYKIPQATLPNFLVRLYSNIDTSLKPVILELGYERKVSNQKARTELDWEPIPVKEAILSCAESVLRLGLVN